MSAAQRRSSDLCGVAFGAIACVAMARWTVAEPQAPLPPATPQALPASQPTPPQIDYMLNCMGCHLEDGGGAPGKVPSLRETLSPLAQSAAGRRYLVQVPGAAQSALSSPALAQVLNWMVRTLSSDPPRHFVDFNAAEVAAYRKSPLVHVAATRAALLAAARRSTSPR